MEFKGTSPSQHASSKAGNKINETPFENMLKK